MASMAGKLRLALIQLAVTANKSQNIASAKAKIKEAASNNANIICLPECFNSPYGVSYFGEYAETIPGETSSMLKEVAKEHSIYLIGGSIPEKENGKLYNTCMVYGPDGEQLAKHRKVHLFDIDVPGGIKFTESDALSAGDSLTMFNAGPWKVGVGICYDIRFSDMASRYDKEGCHLLVYPGAFNMTTGPAHWELLIRSRAINHQVFVAACSPARDENASYVAWGHSTVASPWADVVAKADHTEQIVYSDLDISKIEEVRRAVPIHFQGRPDVYGELK